MRTEFAQTMVALGAQRDDLIFITADLGYMAVEGIAEAWGPRFINAGVAEQNAVSVAAGLAQQGQLPWVYSMSTFATLRPYAQIRDNVCLHDLPVKLVGNGGGYGYGIMGATHHALEDIAVMRVLPNMRVYVPLVAQDLPGVVEQMSRDPHPNYLRLNRPADIKVEIPPFSPWRRIKKGRGALVISTGPVMQALYDMARPDLLDALEIWSVGVFPLAPMPKELVDGLSTIGRVMTMEEHRLSGGLAEALAHRLLEQGLCPGVFRSLYAAGYPSGRYGSQGFHQEESSLRGAALISKIEELLRA